MIKDKSKKEESKYISVKLLRTTINRVRGVKKKEGTPISVFIERAIQNELKINK